MSGVTMSEWPIERFTQKIVQAVNTIGAARKFAAGEQNGFAAFIREEGPCRFVPSDKNDAVLKAGDAYLDLVIAGWPVVVAQSSIHELLVQSGFHGNSLNDAMTWISSLTRYH